MQRNLKNYERIVGKRIIKQIYKKAKKLSDKHILAINSTHQGGGVAEILNSIIPLFNEIGIKFGWRILHGNQDFFTVTKDLHNSLQGEEVNLSETKKRIYYKINKMFSTFTHIDHDLVIVHDPQPLAMINFYKKTQPWIFRCHIDLSDPYPPVWSYIKRFIEKYDHIVVSDEKYKKKDLAVSQLIIHPAIDPLTPKNRPISMKIINKYLRKYKIYKDKPIIAQVSRFDKWKDPVGVVKVFELVRKKVDCRLILLGSLAVTDDPEAIQEINKLQKAVETSKYKKDIQIVIAEDADNDLLVNSIQRAASVIIQKSLKEGFGLVVTEALYKGTPVVASNIGGIPLQVIDGVNGFLHKPTRFRSFSRSIIKLLKDKKLAERLGKNGHEHVKDKFLITRLMLDWLNLFESYLT